MTAPRETPPDRRPRPFPPPEFPPRRRPLFSDMPPAVFPVILGLVAAGLAARQAAGHLGIPGALAEAVLGALAALWLFAVVALSVKYLQAPAALARDLAVLPGQAGIAAAGMGGMALAAALRPFAPGAALGLVLLALLAHGLGALACLGVLRGLPPERRRVSPAWHLTFTGFIVGAPVLAALGQEGAARALFWTMLAVALAVWVASARQVWRQAVPAPLRPLLVVHAAPAAVLATTAAALGMPLLSGALAAFAGAGVLFAALGARWLLAAGFTPLWGALTFPLAATSLALMGQGGAAAGAGAGLGALALGVNLWIGWRVLRLWPGGRLARMTNAAGA